MTKISGYSYNAIKLALKLKQQLGFDIKPIIKRTRAGYWQRSEGAWSWYVETKDGLDIGSSETIKDVLSAKKLSLFGKTGEIFIDKPK